MTWQELSTTAALGTGQRPFRLDDLPASVRALVDVDSPPAQQLLDAAAVWTVARRATVPAAEQPVLIPEEQETAVEASDRLASVLGRVLDQKDDELLTETLLGLRTAGLRVPHRLIVPLTERASTPALRSYLPDAVGARGRWVLANVPDLLPVQDDPSGDWDGALSSRRRWLARERARDAHSAREVVEASWSGEPVAERIEFLQVLVDTAGPDDIAFLDRVVDDRSERVARVAVEGLRRLAFPSLWRTRVTQYARTIRLTPEGVDFAEPAEARATRDLGTGAEATVNALAAVHPGAWPTLAGVSAADILAAGERDVEVLTGLAIAATTARDVELARLVLDAADASFSADVLCPLLGALDVESRFRVAVERKDDAPSVALAALESLPRPWLDPAIRLATDWLGSVRDRLVSAPAATRRNLADREPVLAGLLGALRFAIPPQLARSWAERISLIPPASPQDRRQDLRALCADLMLRAAVWDELRPILESTPRRGP